MPNALEKTRLLQIMSEEFHTVPMRIMGILKLLELDPSQMQDIPTASFRSATRVLFMKYVLDALLNLTPLANIETAAESMQVKEVAQLRVKISDLVRELYAEAGKEQPTNATKTGA